jgi:tRNA threonylcarbamoyladenosine modification (KEOPS) complex  Pcc1 subunit
MTLEVTVRGTSGDVDVLEDALAPEHADGFPRVDTRLERPSERVARLVVEGAHAPSVRAATNANLRWIRNVEDVLAVDPDDPTPEVP